MKVLLISANTEQINMPVLPLGLACVAAAIDKQGHTVKLLNLMMQTDTQKAVFGTIADFAPDLIGISVRNIDDQNMDNSRFLLETVKEVAFFIHGKLMMSWLKRWQKLVAERSVWDLKVDLKKFWPK